MEVKKRYDGFIMAAGRPRGHRLIIAVKLTASVSTTLELSCYETISSLQVFLQLCNNKYGVQNIIYGTKVQVKASPHQTSTKVDFFSVDFVVFC